MAGCLGKRASVPRRDRQAGQEVLSAHRVPLSLRRGPACWPSPALHCDGHLSPESAGCRAITCSSPWASTPSACPRRTSPSRTTSTPRIVTERNVAPVSPRSCRRWAISFDWDRVINTTDPQYYKWTQWIFLQLFKHGLAYKTEMPVNWCTSCKCVLANEEVVEGVCERCGSPVIHKEKSQWMLRITEYADRLIDDLDGVDYHRARQRFSSATGLAAATARRCDFQARPPGDEICGLYHPARHALRRDLYGSLAGACRWWQKWKAPAAERGRGAGLSGRGRRKERLRAHRAEQGEDRRLPGRRQGLSIPVNGKEIPIFISDYVLIDLWHRRDYGRPGP